MNPKYVEPSGFQPLAKLSLNGRQHETQSVPPMAGRVVLISVQRGHISLDDPTKLGVTEFFSREIATVEINQINIGIIGDPAQ